MRNKNVKVQITLPKEIVDIINMELKESFLSKSAWFLKIVKAELDKKGNRTKKIIELDI